MQHFLDSWPGKPIAGFISHKGFEHFVVQSRAPIELAPIARQAVETKPNKIKPYIAETYLVHIGTFQTLQQR